METLTLFLKVILMIGGWFFGHVSERKRRAKEILNLLKRTTIEGDNLGLQLFEEMKSRPTTDWEDIEIRNTNNEGD